MSSRLGENAQPPDLQPLKPKSSPGRTTLTPPAAPSQPEGPKQSKAARSSVKKTIVLFLVAASLAVGTYFARPLLNRHTEAPAAEEEARTRPTSLDENPVALPGAPAAASDINKISEWIRDGRYAEALKACRAAGHSGNLQKQLRYREALCREGLSEWKEAAELYGELNEGGDLNVLSIAAQLGQARCWSQLHRVDETRWQLARLILNSNHPAMQEKPFLGEAFYIRACLETLAEPTPAPQPLGMHGLAGMRIVLGLDRYVDWATSSASLPDGHVARDHQDAKEKPAEIVEIKRGKRFTDQYRATIYRPSVTVSEMLRQIAARTGGELRIAADAEARLSGRSLSVNVVGQPLADVLDALVEPHGVSWTLGSIGLELSAPSAGPTSSDSRNHIRGALRRALSAAPDHPSASAVRLSLSNLEFEAGKFHDAVEGYQRMLDSGPHRPEALPAAYNLGLALLRLSNFRSARERFMQVVDRAPNDYWTALAWWWAARTYLDAGEFDPALPCMIKSLKYAGNSEARPSAVLGICTVHLLKGESVEAHQRLRAERKAVLAKPYRDTAAFLDCLARCRHVRSQQKLSSAEQENLLQALLAVGDEQVVGPAGALLYGQACRELHLESLMPAKYEKPLEYLRGSLAMQMTYELAEYHLKLGQTAPAKEKLLALAAIDRGEWGNRARLELADLALDDGKLEDSLRYSRAVAAGGDGFREAALKRMGTALARLGKHQLAAECFAGRLPGENKNKSE